MALKKEVYLQYKGKEIEESVIMQKAVKAFESESKSAVKSVKLYMKPEDDAAYYVVNDKNAGKIKL